MINSLYIVLGQSKFIKKKMNSLAIKVLSPDQHQVLDVTKCFVTSKNWCQLADKTLMAREFVYFLMNLDCPRTIYKEFIIRYLWTKFFNNISSRMLWPLANWDQNQPVPLRGLEIFGKIFLGYHNFEANFHSIDSRPGKNTTSAMARQ